MQRTFWTLILSLWIYFEAAQSQQTLQYRFQDYLQYKSLQHKSILQCPQGFREQLFHDAKYLVGLQTATEAPGFVLHPPGEVLNKTFVDNLLRDIISMEERLPMTYKRHYDYRSLFDVKIELGLEEEEAQNQMKQHEMKRHEYQPRLTYGKIDDRDRYLEQIRLERFGSDYQHKRNATGNKHSERDSQYIDFDLEDLHFLTQFQYYYNFQQCYDEFKDQFEKMLLPENYYVNILEHQYQKYPEGGRFKLHLDNQELNAFNYSIEIMRAGVFKNRLLTFVVYLMEEEFTEDMGGFLDLYYLQKGTRVPPAQGQMTFFRSDFVYHDAVMAAFPKRLINFWTSIRRHNDIEEWETAQKETEE